jgi:ABC-2 type transport system permease protein
MPNLECAMGKFFGNKVFLVIILVLINIVGTWIYFRVDLTEDKRYSISNASKQIIQDLDSPVIVKVYLEGDNLPGGFQRLKRSITETLQEFKRVAAKNVDYQFIDPNAGSEADRKKLMDDLISKGMQPTTVFDNKDGKKTQEIIFPYATIWHDNTEKTVLLLKGNLSEDAQTKLNQSAEVAEHTLIATIKKISAKNKKKVALLAEFTSLKPISFGGLINSLQENYDLFILESKSSPNFTGIDAIILPNPDKLVDEATKIKLDQYLMNGGKLLFFMDGLRVDTIGLEGSFAQPLSIGLDDMLFKYGVRINKNIVKDGLNMGVIPLVVGDMGETPNMQPVPYRYYPLINNFGKSLITKNIEMVMSKYAGTIDTVNSGVALKKIPLLLTSPNTKVLKAPALITFNEARTDTDVNEYNQGEKVLAYLVEGKFRSVYSNMIGGNYRKESPQTSILVCSDGDLVVNDIDKSSNNPFPLGFDKFTQHQYGNQDFVMNALNYMLDENGIISARAKSLQLRPLNSLKVRDERLKWQIINIALPLLVLVLAGLGRYFYLMKKYGA